MRDRLAPDTSIVGNGDVLNRQQGLELAKLYKLDGIMIGRGVFNDPFVFTEHSPWSNYSREQRIGLYKKHVKLFAETWLDGERPLNTLNKFCKIYINGFDGAKEQREQLMQARSTDELLAQLN
jgi:tRNA-dihydrouridine synthase